MPKTVKKFVGSLVFFEGKGEVLVTKLPKHEPLPKVGSKIEANGQLRKIKDIEYSTHHEFGRGEMIGILLHSEACPQCKRCVKVL
jgi:hypothetical protein